LEKCRITITTGVIGGAEQLNEKRQYIDVFRRSDNYQQECLVPSGIIVLHNDFAVSNCCKEILASTKSALERLAPAKFAPVKSAPVKLP